MNKNVLCIKWLWWPKRDDGDRVVATRGTIRWGVIGRQCACVYTAREPSKSASLRSSSSIFRRASVLLLLPTAGHSARHESFVGSARTLSYPSISILSIPPLSHRVVPLFSEFFSPFGQNVMERQPRANPPEYKRRTPKMFSSLNPVQMIRVRSRFFKPTAQHYTWVLNIKWNIINNICIFTHIRTFVCACVHFFSHCTIAL